MPDAKSRYAQPVLVIAPIFVGSAALSFINQDIGPAVLAAILLVVGCSVSALISGCRAIETWAYVMTFGTCLLVAAGAQGYAETVFNSPMTTDDAWTFYESVVDSRSDNSLESLSLRINAPLAVIVWQFWYEMAAQLGFSSSPYIGIELNAFIVGLTAALIVKCGREIFGADVARLYGISRLCAACGIFWLFGSLFLRDAFSLLFTTSSFWALLRWLNRPASPLQLAMISAVLVASGVCSYYLRVESVLQLAAFTMLAAAVKIYTKAGSTAVRVIVIPILISGMGVAASSRSTLTSTDTISHRQEQYRELGRETSSENSLGMRMVVTQPLPIRLVGGAIMLIVNPMPMWGSIAPNMMEYNIIKTYQGAYLVWLVPWIAAGILTVTRRCLRNLNNESATLFLVIYALATLGAIAITSLETRHHGQFLGASMLLAVLPGTTQIESRTLTKRVAMSWWLFVIAIHLAWTILKLI